MDRDTMRQIVATNDPLQRAQMYEKAQERAGSLQTAVDGWKDDTTRQKWLDEFEERGLSIDQGLDFKAGRAQDMSGPSPLETILWDYGINLRKATLADLGDWGPNYFTSGPALAFRGILDHAYYEKVLGHRNMMTGNPIRHEMRTRAANTYDALTVGEPVINFQERPVRDSEGTMLKVRMEDLVATVQDLPPGTMEWRTVTSEVQWSDEDLHVQMEGTNGILILIEPSKESWSLVERKAGIALSDQYIANNVRADLVMRTVMRIGAAVNRSCVIRIFNLIQGALLTGNDRQGLSRTFDISGGTEDADKRLNGQHWGEFEDRYEFENLNRVIGKKAAIRAIKNMDMGHDFQSYSQFTNRPTMFYDLGGMQDGVGLGGVTSASLNSAFEDKVVYGYDVNLTVVAAISPYLEQDELDRDPASGMLCRYFRTSIVEAIEDAQSIKKFEWGLP